MTHAQIEKLVQKVLDQLEKEIPVDVIRAAKLYGLEVYATEMEKMNAGGVSGILVEKDGTWAIFINHSDSLSRQRFSIAHELGHFLIHKGEQFVDDFPAGEAFYRDGKDNTVEREANYFAACLLMPADQLETIWPEAKDPKDAANRFKVSEVSMTYRLKHLGLITVEE